MESTRFIAVFPRLPLALVATMLAKCSAQPEHNDVGPIKATIDGFHLAIPRDKVPDEVVLDENIGFLRAHISNAADLVLSESLRLIKDPD